MRIIGGTAAGHLLRAPPGLAVRPTPDKVRQAVFNSLGDRVPGARVLDLFSGSGALGLECLSRGAREVVSVERSPRHAQFIRENAQRLGLAAGGGHELRVQDVSAALRALLQAGRCFDLILADPPFGPKTAGRPSDSASQRLLLAVETAPLVADGGRLVLGHARRDGVRVPDGWEEVRVLEHGDSVFRILRVRRRAADLAADGGSAEPPGSEAAPPDRA